MVTQADIYSFGVLLWTMWCGKEPFMDVQGNLLALMMAITQGRRPSLDDPAHNFPEGVKRLLQDCWAQEPEQRPSFEDLQQGGMLERGSLFPSPPTPPPAAVAGGDVAGTGPAVAASRDNLSLQ